MSKKSSFYYKNNRLRQLQGLVNTIKYGSVTEAAKSMGVVQSAVSTQLASLEKQIGFKLFSKVGNQLVPNKKAIQLYEMSVPYLQGIESIYENFIESIRTEESNCIKIAGHHSVFSLILPKYLEILKKSTSKLKLN